MSDFNDFGNPQVAALPKHLRQYIVEQNYEKYTAIDQAVWRYVMRQNYSYLKNVAYYPYIKGLTRAGLSIDRIPNLQEMNDHLGKIGWGAVTVDGFIPPAAFMEYQAYKVLVIAADIRQLNHIEYTPAPDIIHESAGHAPIIADEAYNNYLSYFGSIGAKAMFSAKDFELYEAIRALSILKESPDAADQSIKDAEEKLNHISANMGDPSEMALLGRLHWWTVEYGLIGTLENPKIYGAGLLSSIGESASCMDPTIKKIAYTIDTVNYAYDITKPQPQLFVTPTFQNLIDVLETFANKMAFRVGGAESVQKAINCKNIATVVYSSGIQVTGLFTELKTDSNKQVAFVKSSGPSALSFSNKQLPGHGKEYHKDGFSSPVGKLKNEKVALEDFSEEQLLACGLEIGKAVSLTFESGIHVQGQLEGLLRKEHKLILLTFKNCTVTDSNGAILFQPDWGMYDMAVGENIISVFNGAADKDEFEELAAVSAVATHKCVKDPNLIYLEDIYASIREIRETQRALDKLPEIWKDLKSKYSTDWLAAMEVLELLVQQNVYPALAKAIREDLELRQRTEPDLAKLIKDGFYVIENPVNQEITA